MRDQQENLKPEMENATRLHGHLGAFLAVGVRIAVAARKALNLNFETENSLHVTAKVPLQTPFSCVLDGIQAITKCTVGNQKLKIKNTQDQISAQFKTENSNRQLTIIVKQEIVKTLMAKIGQGVPNEKLTSEIIKIPDAKLLVIKNEKP